MRQKHWRVWTCSLGCSAGFQSSEGLRSHISEKHIAEVSPENIGTLVSLSSKADLTRAKGKCPLCLSCDIKNSRLYVGIHLEQLALFVLPQNQEEEEQEISSEDDNNSEQGSTFGGVHVQESEAGSQAFPESELEGADGDHWLEEQTMNPETVVEPTGEPASFVLDKGLRLTLPMLRKPLR